MHPTFMINHIFRSRIVLPPEPELKEIVHEVVAATTDIAQLKQTIEDLKGQLADLDEQLAERTFKSGPYSSVWQRFKPENKDQWYSLINTLVTILVALLTIMVTNQQSETLPTRDQEQQVIEQLNQINEHLEEDQEIVEQLNQINEHLEEDQEIVEQLKQINERLAEKESPSPSPKAKKDSKPPKEHC